MDLLFAPLEGITTYIYRNAHSEMFGGCDCYYAPFITPSDNEKRSTKGLRDVSPAKNKKIKLKVQVLTNDAPSFVKFAEKIKAAGYDELNINLGCPSSTVTKKGKGSGFLKEKDKLDRFLYDIFEKSDIKISVKTRLGYSEHDEIEELIKIYNKYPLELLTVHPRTSEDYYNGVPDYNAFLYVMEKSKNALCYNGDILTAEDYENTKKRFCGINAVMLGRGAIQNPAVFREINGGARLKTEELIAFTKRISAEYAEVMGSEFFALNKLKEIWMYCMRNFPEEKKILKAIKKATKPSELQNALLFLPEIK